MTIQWTIVAVFLYVEMFFVAILLLPSIRPYMCRMVRAVEQLQNANVYSWVIVGILLLLFSDAMREMHKYSATSVLDLSTHTADADALIHMRLFRAQRNLYISGFALFLWLVVRRLLVTLISREEELASSRSSDKKND